jgi:hypothetical protein
MRNSAKIFRSCFIGLLIICIAVPVFAYERNDNYVELSERLGTSPEIAIEVPFDAPLMASTVSTRNVYVEDEQGSRVPLSRNMGSDWKSIIVTPLEQYEAGNTYTLYIRKAVKYAAGREIENGFKLKFTIAKTAQEPLPKVGSKENLRKLLEEASVQNYYYDYGVKKMRNGAVTFDTAVSAPAAAVNESVSNAKQAKQEESTGSGDYSKTNVQVDGVDEADIVKTDGKYLYQVNNNRIVVAEIYPSDSMKIKKIIGLEEENVSPMELFLDDKNLIVIGSSNGSIPVYKSQAKSIMPSRDGYYYQDETVKMLIYDITNKDNIKKAREIELEGRYLSSRKIGSKLYLVSNKHLNYYRIYDSEEVNDTPSYRDTAINDEYINIDYGKIGYFPESIEPNYMIVAGVDFDNPAEGVNAVSYTHLTLPTTPYV